MTQSFSIIALFCEDIRLERAGIISLVGVLSDTVNLSGENDADRPADSKAISKLCIYVRLNFDPADQIAPGIVKLILPGNDEIELIDLSEDVINIAKKDALNRQDPLASVLTFGMLGVPPALGRFTVQATLGDKIYVCGSVNFRPVPKTPNPIPSTTS